VHGGTYIAEEVVGLISEATTRSETRALSLPRTLAAANPEAERSKSRTKKLHASRLGHRRGGGSYVEEDAVTPAHATETRPA
jgi:ribosomal protein L19E